MKKIICILLTVALLLPAAALACEQTALVARSESACYVYSDSSWWAITDDCRVAGIMRVDEQLACLPVQTAPGQWVAGKLPGGWAKYTAAVRTVDMGCRIAGLTRLDNVTITIFPEYVGFARDVIHDLLGGDVEISANAVSACAVWWMGDYASMIFFNSQSDGVQIGWAAFNGGEDVTPLMCGHFGGEWHFGLKTSEELPPEVIRAEAAAKAQAEAQARAEADACASAQASAASAVSVGNSGSINQSGDGCYRNNTVIQINLGIVQTVKNCIKLLKECAQ